MMSLRAYARRRKTLGLPGASLKAVQRAIASERLKESVARDGAGTPSISDPSLADREWIAHTDAALAPTADAPVDAAPAESGETYADARRRKEVALAHLRELELARKAGQLCLGTAVEAELGDLFVEIRSKLLGLPHLAKQLDDSFTVAQVQTLDRLVHAALTALADGEEKQILEYAKKAAIDAVL